MGLGQTTEGMMERKSFKITLVCIGGASLLLMGCGEGPLDLSSPGTTQDESVGAGGSTEPGGETSSAGETVVESRSGDNNSPANNDPQSYAGFFGRASDFNVFAAGDVRQWGTDIQGPLAVGGRLELEAFGIGTKCAQGTVLVAEGEVHARTGKFYGAVTVPAGTTIEATVDGEIRDLDPEFSIADIHQELISLSSRLANERTNGQVTDDLNGMHLIGSNPGRNVFNLSAGTLDNLSGFRMSIPDGSYAVINVRGQQSRIAAFGFLGNEAHPNQVLFNFPEATELSAEGVGIKGSILAPRAHFRFNGAHVDGQVMVTSLEGNGESHNVPFDPYDPYDPYEPYRP
jgi:choice-of-anchor A domain-containing protein